MTTVFVAGSINIKNLDQKVKERLDRIVESDFTVIVGDADGADTSIQNYLLEKGVKHAMVFCSGTKPRNNIGGWKVKNIDANYASGTRAFFTAKDIEMARVADYGFMIWDSKSTGTLNNVLELLRQKKKSVVFVNKNKSSVTVGDLEQLECLIQHMSPHAQSKADEKIGLHTKIDALKYKQNELFAG